jgi:hypothetical protein
MTAHRITRALVATLAALLLVSAFAEDASARGGRRRRGRPPTGCAASPACAALGAPAQAAFQQLFVATQVSFETIGAADVIPPEVTALRVLIADPAAAGAVDLLYRNGSLAGKVYAIIASWLVAPSEYHARREGLVHRNGNDNITTTLGSNTARTTITQLLSPHQGARRFPPGTNSLDAFCAGVMRNDDRAFQTDIAGGGASVTMIYGPQVTRADCEAHLNPNATPTPPPQAPVRTQIQIP